MKPAAFDYIRADSAEETVSLLAQHGDPEAEYNIGDVVEFPTPDGTGRFAGVVRECSDDWLLFDFNHPLAGKNLNFEVEESYDATATCETCHGNGAEPGTPITTCDKCGGQGILQAVTRSPFGQVVRQVACDKCGGEGKIPETPCEVCDGRGLVVGHRRLEVDVPAGIADGQRIRLSGRGHAGERGGPPGDLYVVVQVDLGDGWLRDEDDLVTVSDIPGFASSGGMIEFTRVDNRIGVTINTDTVTAAHLVVQDRLLRLARTVTKAPQGR